MLGSIPGWGVRWGITAVFVVILLLLSLAWFIRYPDVISAQIVLITEHPPVRLVARSSGKLVDLKVDNNQAVEKGDILAELENTATLDDIFTLEAWLQQHAPLSDDALDSIPQGLNLGRVQGGYAQLLQLSADYRFFLAQDDVFAQISTLRNQILYLDSLNEVLLGQRENLQREVQLAKENFDRNKTLAETGNISQLELENIETFYLQYKRQLDAIKANRLRNKIQQEELQADIIRLRQGRSNDDVDKLLPIQSLAQRLLSDLAQWKQDFLLIAPISGRISLNRLIAEGQFIAENSPILAILPEASQRDILAKGFLPATRSGKVKTGMAVNVYLDAYPYQEYGILKGQLRHIAQLPEQNGYLIEIGLPDSLITTYGERIPLTQEQPGRAGIITEDKSILGRLLDGLVSLVKNN